jgi:hypothetical protein
MKPSASLRLEYRPYEVGVALVVVEQRLLELAQLEEVVVLLHLDHRRPCTGHMPVDQLILGVVVLARDAVQAGVLPSSMNPLS